MTNELKPDNKHLRQIGISAPLKPPIPTSKNSSLASNGKRNPETSSPLDARKTALSILTTLDKENKTLDNIIEDFSDKIDLFSKKDRALMNALVYGVLRWRGRLDHIIEFFSNTPLTKIDLIVLNILRIALFQIIYLSRIPASAAVNTSVELSKSFAAPWVTGFVNAILRNAVRKFDKIPFPDLEKDPVSTIAVRNSFPKWLIKRWLYRFGHEETNLLCRAINTIPPITIRTNTLKTTREKLIKSLQHEVEKIKSTTYAPDGICFFNPKSSIPKIQSFRDGWFVVQDEAAQLVTLLLDPRPGDNVLDACSGLGGKTGHIAQIMKNKGSIIAIDKDDKKLSRLSSEMIRLGISITKTIPCDLEMPLNEKGLGLFDRILLDAPCSGLGIIRRNPDIKWSTSKKNINFFKERQLLFIDNLACLVKPSGVLVYAVCSTEPEENEEVVKDFLSNHPEFVIKKNCVPQSLKNKALISGGMYLKTSPINSNMDGFFSVCFQKKPV